MTTTQMNMRIDASLKEAGDRAIREGGSTPSEIVRAVWEYASKNRHKPQAMQNLKDFLEGKLQVAQTPVDEEPQEVQQIQPLGGALIVEQFCRDAGIDLAHVPVKPYDDIKVEAFDDGWFSSTADGEGGIA